MKIDLNKIFLFFLPFAQALTINLFFPLKISEIALLIMPLFYINKRVISGRTRWFLNKNHLLAWFCLLVTVSFLINIRWNYPYGPKHFPFRVSRVGDSFIRLCYFYICVLAYYISFKILSKDTRLLKYWIFGAVIAGCYGWYLFLSTGLGIPYYKLPGMDEHPQFLRGIVRCGTFKEGNYYGLYLVVSAAIAFYLRKFRTGWFLLATVATSLSTISIVSGFLFLGFYYRHIFFTDYIFFTCISEILQILPCFIILA